MFKIENLLGCKLENNKSLWVAWVKRACVFVCERFLDPDPTEDVHIWKPHSSKSNSRFTDAHISEFCVSGAQQE